MKIRKIVFLLVTACTVMACQDDEALTPNHQAESTLTFTAQTPPSSEVNQVPFTIESAGVYNTYLYTMISYTGGLYGHEFSLNWDGKVIEDGDKKIVKLSIFHLTNDDKGEKMILDSLVLNIGDMGLPEELLKDENLYYNVINSSKPENQFLIQAYQENTNNGGDDINSEDIEVTVVDTDCVEKGYWKELWLKKNGEELYYMPVDILETVNYTPVKNDKLKISYEYSYLSDSTYICDFMYNHNFEVVKITKVEKIN